ncbi:MAG: prolyl oligopeptidase family serine peptidase [Clostridia bacterium]|nr:prolyl oligopeptidase family serine peptidase [Clostridia bacterium]
MSKRENGSLQCLAIIVSLVMALCLASSANVVAASENAHLPTIEEELAIKTWLVVGPFSIGQREDFVDPLYEHGGQLHIAPEAGMQHSSTMTPGGVAEWKAAVADANGSVAIPDTDVDFDRRESCYGFPGYLSLNYGYAEFESCGDQRVLIRADRTAAFWLNGIQYEGNPYGYGFVLIPAVLKDGVNKVLAKTTRGAFTFRVLPAPEPAAFAMGDLIAPDAILGARLDAWIGVPVINCTEKEIDVEVVLGSADNALFAPTSTRLGRVAPLSTIKVPVPVKTLRAITDQDAPEGKMKLAITLRTEGFEAQESITLSAKSPTEVYTTTFVSRNDGSVQKFSVVPPANFDPAAKYGLILTLHGASVECQGQAACYSPKDWAYVVAATNRREFGFDWQDWGRLNALETLDEAMKAFSIDPNRVWLTGHSMGGHGTWNIGLQYPDKFAAIAPSAGWNSFETYVPFSLRQDCAFAPPELLAIQQSVERGNNSLAIMENAANLPAYVLQGSADDDVPVDHARRAVQTLRWLGSEVQYCEKPGLPHWWDEEGPGTACVDYPELMDFLKTHTRNPVPTRVVYKTTDLGINNGAYWAWIDKQTKVFHESIIDARSVAPNRIAVSTDNVAQFTLDLKEGLVGLGIVDLVVDGETIPMTLGQYGPVTLHRTDGGKFTLGRVAATRFEKTPEMFGPIRAAYFSPFVLVYGTRGSEDETNVTLSLARLQAQRWWRQGNGYTRIIPDTAVTDDIIANYNLILFGGPNINSFTTRISEGLPVKIDGQRIELGNHAYAHDNLSVRFVYPNPLNPKRYVVVNAGTSIDGLKMTELVNIIRSSAPLPDYVIYGEKAWVKGWSGFLAAGFFDNRWQVDESQGYFRETAR